MQKEIISKPKLLSILILIIGGFLATIFGIFMIIKGIEKHGPLIIGIPFFAIGLYSLYWVLNYDILKISNGKLIFKSITGLTKKTISLSELKSYTEIEKENAKLKNEVGYMKWKDLTLYGDNFRYKISSTSYTNYKELRNELTKGLKRNLQAEIKWQNNNLTYIGLGQILFGLFIGFWFWQVTKDSLTDKIMTLLISVGFVGYGIFLLYKRKKPAGNNV
ncbi:hypothetical protein LRR18_16100 [Mangrovimonas sp. AS39]|uniref:hypothetical protein n=1 Tax=Mangrovimonas futianensis TaxID=2895523 RepID=UPI001E51CEB6|nr:hypothetical protein [Mangrovimonas futianensis]MCF1193112.1 hypothetical protein [Mangrovimonas futianensis]MCF1196802.1 hypothetical protein [Mangrovimonas futianensis]